MKQGINSRIEINRLYAILIRKKSSYRTEPSLKINDRLSFIDKSNLNEQPFVIDMITKISIH